MPLWIDTLAIGSLLLAGVSAVVIGADIALGRRQPMWIMNVVWPVTALYAGPLALWSYFRMGRAARGQPRARHDDSSHEKPPWQSVALATTHCGSGCTLADILSESFLILVPLTLFGRRIFAAWTVDFAAAFVLGIAFQYFTIPRAERRGVREGLRTAVKVDALSLTAWQIGMYGWMALVTFLLVGHELQKTGPAFWFMMQVAMLFGFLTSYPVNWWLVRTGIKKAM